MGTVLIHAEGKSIHTNYDGHVVQDQEEDKLKYKSVSKNDIK